MAPVLSRLGLNRATLARQGLLEPLTSQPIATAVARAGSLQAQHPDWPPIALWSRAGDRAIAGLPAAIADRSAVRAALMRITVHVVAASDFWPMSALSQPLRHAQFKAIFKADVADSKLGRRLASGHPAVIAALREEPLRIRDMDAIMARQLPDLAEHPNRLFWRHIAATLPLVHVPFDGEQYGRSRYALAEEWLGPPPVELDEDAALLHLTERYLAAFGPAGANDLMAYTGRRGTPARWRRAFERLDEQGRLVHFVDENGRPLVDLVDAPRPDASVAAPPRLLARWDSLLLSHATRERGRIIADEHRASVYTRNADVLPTFLVDGMVAGTWELDVARATIGLHPFGAMDSRTTESLVATAEQLLAALAPADRPRVEIG